MVWYGMEGYSLVPKSSSKIRPNTRTGQLGAGDGGGSGVVVWCGGPLGCALEGMVCYNGLEIGSLV